MIRTHAVWPMLLLSGLLGPAPSVLAESKTQVVATSGPGPLLADQRPAVAPSERVARQKTETEIVDGLFKMILDQGFLITLAPLDELRTQAEVREPDQVLLNVAVALKMSEVVRHALEATARELGGLSLDALFEADYGIVSWQTRAFRVSSDPRTLEYFQRRVASLVFVLELGLDNGEVYECFTGDVWRFPLSPISALFAYGGRPTIQGLGLSPAFDTKDYGFVAVRDTPVKFIYRAVIPEADLKRLTRVTGRMIERNDRVSEGECRKSRAASSGAADPTAGQRVGWSGNDPARPAHRACFTEGRPRRSKAW